METISDNLKKKDDDQLASWQSQFRPGSDTFILAEKEWRRREMIEQHKLDVKLMSKQVRSMKFTAIIGVIATLAGAALGAYLQYSLSQRPPKNTQSTIQQESGKVSAVDRHNKTAAPKQTLKKHLSTSSKEPPN